MLCIAGTSIRLGGFTFFCFALCDGHRDKMYTILGGQEEAYFLFLTIECAKRIPEMIFGYVCLQFSWVVC